MRKIRWEWIGVAAIGIIFILGIFAFRGLGSSTGIANSTKLVESGMPCYIGSQCSSGSCMAKLTETNIGERSALDWNEAKVKCSQQTGGLGQLSFNGNGWICSLTQYACA